MAESWIISRATSKCTDIAVTIFTEYFRRGGETTSLLANTVLTTQISRLRSKNDPLNFSLYWTATKSSS